MENKVKDFRELIKKTFGKNSGILIEDADNIKIEKFPSGSFLLDLDLKGGWAKGTLIEIFGEKVRVKNYACSSIKNNIVKQDVKLNLYIKINDACNANCQFCSNRQMQDMGDIDLKKLEVVSN